MKENKALESDESKEQNRRTSLFAIVHMCMWRNDSYRFFTHWPQSVSVTHSWFMALSAIYTCSVPISFVV